MSREAVKRIERGIQKLIKADGDHCSICRRPFAHGDRTHYGRIAGQRPAIAGDCCADRINLTLGMGVYTDRQYDVLAKAEGGPAPKRAESPEALSDMVDGLHSFITGVDVRAAEIGSRAGMGTKSAATFLKPSHWKTDDAAWFAARPDRSHRLRPLLKDELETLPGAIRTSRLPKGHELQVLVRQVEPGARVRTFFGRNLAVPIADEEAVIHALFDLVSQRPAGAAPDLDARTLKAMADSYGETSRGPLS